MEIEPVHPDYIPPEKPVRSEAPEPLPAAPPEEDVTEDEEIPDEDLGDNVDLMA